MQMGFARNMLMSLCVRSGAGLDEKVCACALMFSYIHVCGNVYILL